MYTQIHSTATFFVLIILTNLATSPPPHQRDRIFGTFERISAQNFPTGSNLIRLSHFHNPKKFHENETTEKLRKTAENRRKMSREQNLTKTRIFFKILALKYVFARGEFKILKY